MLVKNRLLNVFVLGIAALTAAYSYAQSAAPKPSSANPQQTALPADWGQLVERANKEGKLILFGAPDNHFRDKVIGAFNKQYPKIKVEYRIATKTSDLVSKVSSEKRAGIHQLDLVLWGSNGIYGELMPAGYMVPIKDLLVLPDFSDSSRWVQGKLEYSDKEEKYIAAYAQSQGVQFMVNKKLVDLSKLQSYEDLLDPRYAGKIVIGHPRHVGQSRYAFGYFHVLYGEDYFKKLAAQKPVVVKDVKQMIEWVAHGKYAIGISPGGQHALRELIDAGIPIAGMQAKEGGYYSPGYSNISAVKDAPHPNAAKLFANWIFTREAQEVVVAQDGSSVRTDVANSLKFDKDKKYYAPHLQKNEEIQLKGIEAFDKYFPQ
jgi:iron(III) transport system substrate-binding protein